MEGVVSSLRYCNGKTGQLLMTASKLLPYFPAKNPKRTAANPSNPCNSQFDLDFPASANFNARSVSSFSFSNAVRLIRK